MRDHVGYPYQPVTQRRSLTTAQDARLRQQPTSPYRSSLHPQDTHFTTGFDSEEDDTYSLVPARLTPRSAIRYRPTIQQRSQHRPRMHWLTWVGVAMFIMIFGWIVLTLLGNWWQTTLDDWHFGRPRTFQIDQNVGHFNFTSHFVALNLNGKIEVIETQPQNPNQQQSTHMYIAATLATDQNLQPVTLQFEDLNGDGKPDMLVFVGNTLQVPLYNNGTSFQSQPPSH
jgi:hypothetical protein